MIVIQKIHQPHEYMVKEGYKMLIKLIIMVMIQIMKLHLMII